MDCYACDQEATERCSRCGNPYCRDHGDDPPSGGQAPPFGGQALCADCLDPLNAAPSSAVFRAALLSLLVGSVLALWLLVRPPALPGESPEVIQPLPSPVPSPFSTPEVPGAEPTPSPSEPPQPSPTIAPEPSPEGPIEYTVVENDTWLEIAAAFGVDAEELAAANGRTLDDFIQPGEVLVIPQ